MGPASVGRCFREARKFSGELVVGQSGEAGLGKDIPAGALSENEPCQSFLVCVSIQLRIRSQDRWKDASLATATCFQAGAHAGSERAYP